jgi:hypothetical protein
MIWACIADIGARAIGKAAEDIVPLVTPKAVAPTPVAVTTTPVRAFTPPSGVARTPLTPPPPDAAPTPVRASASSPVPAGPAIPSPANQPLSDLIDDLEQETPVPTPVPAAARARTPSSQRFRQSNTGIGRPIASSGARRPQAQASPVSIPAARNNPTARRGATEADEAETAAEADWRSREPIAVDDSQLVDWQTETTAATDDDFGRKR